jgi:hypothetical protein
MPHHLTHPRHPGGAAPVHQITRAAADGNGDGSVTSPISSRLDYLVTSASTS